MVISKQLEKDATLSVNANGDSSASTLATPQKKREISPMRVVAAATPKAKPKSSPLPAPPTPPAGGEDGNPPIPVIKESEMKPSVYDKEDANMRPPTFNTKEWYRHDNSTRHAIWQGWLNTLSPEERDRRIIAHEIKVQELVFKTRIFFDSFLRFVLNLINKLLNKTVKVPLIHSLKGNVSTFYHIIRAQK